MAKRRAAGEGALFKASDGYWNCIIELPRDADGKRQRKRIRAKTQKAVLVKRDQVLHDLQSGSTKTSEQTCEQYFALWLETTIKPTLKASTLSDYQKMIRLYITPHIGHIKLKDLSAAHVQKCISALVDAGLSPRTIGKIKAIIGGALERAVKWGDLMRNVARLVDVPSVDRYDARFLQADEAQRLLDTVTGTDDEVPILLGLLLGFRRGEALAVRWADVDYQQGIIRVRGTVKHLDGKVIIDTPKTDGSVRSVPMPTPIRAALERQWDRLQTARRDPTWHEHGLVSPNDTGGIESPNHFVHNHFKPALVRAKLDAIRFHDLRHSCAALLIASGTPINVVQLILGHSNIGTTADLYGHIYDELPRAALDTMTGKMQRKG